MTPAEIKDLRETYLKLNQTQFASLMGVHPMTVSRWERGVVAPTPHQLAFLAEFKKGATKKAAEEAKAALVAAGIVAAIFILLNAARRG